MRLTSAPMSALSKTDGVDVDGEESMLVPFLLNAVGSQCNWKLDQMFVCMGGH